MRSATDDAGVDGMADHDHGSMDIHVHEKTFDGFITFVTRAVIVIVVLVVFMALVNA
jgi:Bacterial aa3 type cytochrome c oxidase subunit IV